MKAIEKIFGGINLTWPKLIIAAIIAGGFTAAMAIIPEVQNTSFNTIAVTFEVWILFGILIIMNSKNNLDAALKCFVFFLISQPLVYLIQVPFSYMGWGLFGYYRYWFYWTLLCLPMGYIGYYMKKDKWYGYLILLPMIWLTALSYMGYFSDFLFSSPRYSLITIFCAAVMILYPVAIFKDRRIRAVGAAIGGVAVVVLTVIGLMNPPIYDTDLILSGEEYQFDDSYTAYLEDRGYGEVEIIYEEGIESYIVHAELRRAGETVLIMTSPEGETSEFDVQIERNRVNVDKKE